MRKWIAGAALVMLGLAIWSVLPITAQGDEADERLCVVTHVDVMPNFTAEGRTLLRQFATASRKDPGNIGVDVFEELSRPNHSTVVEVWKNRKSYDDHLAIDHVRDYRTKLQPMLGSPFDERLHRSIR